MAVEIPCNSLTDNLELMKDEIHVFHVSLDLSPALRKQLEETLSDDERRRAAHFHFEKDRNRFVTGRGFLLKILGWLLRLPPSSLIFLPWRSWKTATRSSDGGPFAAFQRSAFRFDRRLCRLTRF
jgi:4'-phosphopantetheinyl transferase